MKNNKKNSTKSITARKVPIVVVEDGDNGIIRTSPTPTENPPTPKQLIQRKKFALILELLKPVMTLLNTYFGFPEGVRSRYDAAKSYYLTNVIEVIDNVNKLHFHKIIFAKGFLLNVTNLKCVKRSGSSLFLSWVDNSNQGENKDADQLTVVVLQEETNEYQLFLKTAKRDEMEVVLHLAPQFNRTDVHVYAFIVAVDGKSNSTSQYLGKFEVL